MVLGEISGAKKNKETTKFEGSERSVLSSEKFEKRPESKKYICVCVCVYLCISIFCVHNSIILSVNIVQMCKLYIS